mmetsp:Transcript_2702/g.6423  ORF Transcript_2702/g.6423 Transcript_2702/m.6423 type:complete len:229 (-) Transcript_2702:462-1148(-)
MELQEVLNQGNSKCRRLSRSSFGDTDKVTALKANGDSLSLDGGGIPVSHVLEECPQEGRVQEVAVAEMPQWRRGLPALAHNVVVFPKDSPITVCHFLQRLGFNIILGHVLAVVQPAAMFGLRRRVPRRCPEPSSLLSTQNGRAIVERIIGQQGVVGIVPFKAEVRLFPRFGGLGIFLLLEPLLFSKFFVCHVDLFGTTHIGVSNGLSIPVCPGNTRGGLFGSNAMSSW